MEFPARCLAIAFLTLASRLGAAPPVTAMRSGTTDFVSMTDVCGHLGLHFSFSSRGRTMTIRGSGHSAVLLGTTDTIHGQLIYDGVHVSLGDRAIERGGRFFVSRVDYERRLVPLFRPDLLGPPPPRPRVIVLDPGHGGPDPGAANPRFRVHESTFTLDVALRLRPLLIAQGWTVYLTRTRDTDARGATGAQKGGLKGPAIAEDKRADLIARALAAREHHADVFLSLHFDAGPRPTTRGSMIFVYNPAGQRSSSAWGGGRGDAQGAMPGNRFDAWNTLLADALYRNLPRQLGTEDDGERMQDLSVLRNNGACPGVLVEPAYISNDGEAQRIMSPAFRQKVAEVLAEGLRGYAATVGSLQPRRPFVGPPR